MSFSIQRTTEVICSCGSCGISNYTVHYGARPDGSDDYRVVEGVEMQKLTIARADSFYSHSTAHHICRACLAELKAEVNRASSEMAEEERRAKSRAFRAGRAAAKRERTTRGTLVAAGREWFAAAPERWAAVKGGLLVFRTRSNGWVVAHGSRWLCSGNQTRTEAMRWLEAQGMDLDLGEHEERA